MIIRKVLAITNSNIGKVQLIQKRRATGPLGGYGYSKFGHIPEPYPLVSKIYHTFIVLGLFGPMLDWEWLGPKIFTKDQLTWMYQIVDNAYQAIDEDSPKEA